MSLNIAVILGTSRHGRRSENAARLVEKVGSEMDDVETVFVDPREFDLPPDGNNKDERNEKYADIIKNADGFFIVTPEYNHSFPGSLKRLLDNANLDHYIHKPVVIGGVSSGRWGGLRAIEHLIPVLRELGMVVSFEDVQFPNIKDIFNEDGELQDEKYIERIQRSYKELIWLATILKWGRENLPNKYHSEE